MKSVIIKDKNGKVVLSVKKTKKGVDVVYPAHQKGNGTITVVHDDNTRQNFKM